MNTTVPADRDLPPGRHTEIRAELQRAVSSRGFRFAPLVAAVAALSVIGLIAYFAPWRQEAAPPAQQTITTGPIAPATPVIAGLSAEDQRKIAEGCREAAEVAGVPKLYNYVTTEDTKHALVFVGDSAIDCLVDGPMHDYSASARDRVRLEWLAGPFAVDSTNASRGGDVLYTRPARKGSRGFVMRAGRIGPEVARVTMTADGTTVDAVLANGTFLARVLRPSTWEPPAKMPKAVVRAYSADGALLRSSDQPDPTCYKTPYDEVLTLHGDRADLATCVLARKWR